MSLVTGLMILLVGVKVQSAYRERCVGGPAKPGQTPRNQTLLWQHRRAVGCTFMSIARYIQYILKHIELRIYGAHFSPVTSSFNCTNLIW